MVSRCWVLPCFTVCLRLQQSRGAGSSKAQVEQIGAQFPANCALFIWLLKLPQTRLMAALSGCDKAANVAQKLCPYSCSCKASRSSSIPPQLSLSAENQLSCLFKLCILRFRSTWCLGLSILITPGPEFTLPHWLQFFQHDHHQLDDPSSHDVPSGILLAIHSPRGKFDLQKMQFPGSLFYF